MAPEAAAPAQDRRVRKARCIARGGRLSLAGPAPRRRWMFAVPSGRGAVRSHPISGAPG